MEGGSVGAGKVPREPAWKRDLTRFERGLTRRMLERYWEERVVRAMAEDEGKVNRAVVVEREDGRRGARLPEGGGRK